jgi:hypothetical protein
MTISTKSAAAAIGISIDWDGVIPAGDTISSSVWASSPAGLTFADEDDSALVTTATVSGGSEGGRYLAINTVVGSSGWTDSQQRLIQIMTAEVA